MVSGGVNPRYARGSTPPRPGWLCRSPSTSPQLSLLSNVLIFWSPMWWFCPESVTVSGTVEVSVCFCLFWPWIRETQHNSCGALMGCRRVGFMAKLEKTCRNYRQRRLEYVIWRKCVDWAGVGCRVLIRVELRGTGFDCGVVWPRLTQVLVPLPAAHRTIAVIMFKCFLFGDAESHTQLTRVFKGSVWTLMSWTLAHRNLLADDITPSCVSQY